MKNLRYWSFGFGTLIACILNVLAYAQQQSNYPIEDYSNYQTVPQQIYSNPMNEQSPMSAQNLMGGGQNQTNNQPTLRIGIVNTKKCLEESKLGKQEQANFERMKNQMESILQEKEKILEEIESKLNDDDYMDSVSDEVASELKRKRRAIRNEGMQLQNQYMQTLQQTNVKIIQKLTDAIGKASSQVAQDASSGQPIDVVFTDEACTYYSPRLDVSNRIITKMNAIFDAEQKDNAPKPQSR